MAKVIIGTTMSLDGFVADERGSVGRLYPDRVLQNLDGRRGGQEAISRSQLVVPDGSGGVPGAPPVPAPPSDRRAT